MASLFPPLPGRAVPSLQLLLTQIGRSGRPLFKEKRNLAELVAEFGDSEEDEEVVASKDDADAMSEVAMGGRSGYQHSRTSSQQAVRENPTRESRGRCRSFLSMPTGRMTKRCSKPRWSSIFEILKALAEAEAVARAILEEVTRSDLQSTNGTEDRFAGTFFRY